MGKPVSECKRVLGQVRQKILPENLGLANCFEVTGEGALDPKILCGLGEIGHVVNRLTG